MTFKPQIPKFVDDESKTWEERFRALESHHEIETKYLIGEIEKLSSMEMFEKRLRMARGVRDYGVCQRCRGMGVNLYGSTSVWMGGIGGASMTWGLCDRCWGSGDQTNPFHDLKKWMREQDEDVRKRAATYLADMIGVGFKTLRPALEELCKELDKFERQRRPRPKDWDTVTRCLAKALRGMLNACDEKDHHPQG